MADTTLKIVVNTNLRCQMGQLQDFLIEILFFLLNEGTLSKRYPVVADRVNRS
jgi:hypothetical protein